MRGRGSPADAQDELNGIGGNSQGDHAAVAGLTFDLVAGLTKIGGEGLVDGQDLSPLVEVASEEVVRCVTGLGARSDGSDGGWVIGTGGGIGCRRGRGLGVLEALDRQDVDIVARLDEVGRALDLVDAEGDRDELLSPRGGR